MKNSKNSMRLFKIATKFNVSIDTIVNQLHNSGFQIDYSPYAKITPEMYKVIEWAYGDDRIKKEELIEKRKNREDLRKALFPYLSEHTETTDENSSNINVWQPIDFKSYWLETDTSLLDDIAPSWNTKRNELRENIEEYKDFLEKLKRQHAIETGIVEKLYDLKEGITQTFIKSGFVESLIQHGDTNIETSDLMKFLKDHYDALNIIFDFVKEDRILTKGFLFELHQLITSNQSHTIAINSNGQLVKIPLLKGAFKEHDNNPRRDDGSVYYYCPPIHVHSEIEKLISIYYSLEKERVNPAVIATWLHHAFTQIHPFQDGNGRIARLLATMIFIKHGYFPFTVKRTEKIEYINALEKADKNQPNDLVKFFCKIQKKNIEAALNVQLKPEREFHSLQNIAENLASKIKKWHDKKTQEEQLLIENNRNKIFEYISDYVDIVLEQLKNGLKNSGIEIYLDKNQPQSDKFYWYNKQIINFARTHNYFYNKNLPRGWFKYTVSLPNNSSYDIIISIHHFGYGSDTLAIGCFMEYYPPEFNKDNNTDILFTPLEVAPHTISLVGNSHNLKPNIGSYISDVLSISLTKIMGDFSI